MTHTYDPARLDLRVALAEGHRPAPAHPDPDPETGRYWLQLGNFGSVQECPRYCTDPGAGGHAIIERERIELTPDMPIDGYWTASVSRAGAGNSHMAIGRTALYAAMRAWVEFKDKECVK